MKFAPLRLATFSENQNIISAVNPRSAAAFQAVRDPCAAHSLFLLLLLSVHERHQRGSVAEPEALGSEPLGVVEFAVDLPVGTVAGDGRVQRPLAVPAAEAGDVPLLGARDGCEGLITWIRLLRGG